MSMVTMKGLDYIAATREYLDYLESHLQNVALAFENISNACDGMAWVGDDETWHNIKFEISRHDLSKFSKDEFTQYRAKFFGVPEETVGEADFLAAWEHHKENNHHHWDTAESECDIVHMIVDWTAMSYEFEGTAQSYYEEHKNEIDVSPEWIPFMYEVFEAIDSYTREGGR